MLLSWERGSSAPHIGLLPLSYIAGGDVRPVATNGLESGRLQGFL